MRPRELLLLTMALCCLSCTTPQQHVSAPQEDVADEPSVVAADGGAPSDDRSADLSRFFRDIPPEEISLQTFMSVRVHGDEPPGYFAAMGEMTGLRRISISHSFPDEDLGRFIESCKEHRIVFTPFLTDEFVNTLATLKELRKIEIWYGRLSDEQEATIRAALPDCVIWQNLNYL